MMTAEPELQPTTETTAGRPAGPSAARAATLLATISAGLAAGFFVTYSISVMRGLARLDDAGFVTTMNHINDTVRTPWFLAIFAGTPLLAALGALLLQRQRRHQPALLVAVGAGVYLLGVIVVTFAGNVPLNEELGEHRDLSQVDLGAVRGDFEGTWNTLNTVRSLSALVAFLAMALALSGARGGRATHADVPIGPPGGWRNT